MVCLHGVHGHRFGYALANGIVGVYGGEQRYWRIKVSKYCNNNIHHLIRIGQNFLLAYNYMYTESPNFTVFDIIKRSQVAVVWITI